MDQTTLITHGWILLYKTPQLPYMCVFTGLIKLAHFSCQAFDIYLQKLDRGTVSVQDLIRVRTTKRRACLSVFNKIFAEL